MRASIIALLALAACKGPASGAAPAAPASVSPLAVPAPTTNASAASPSASASASAAPSAAPRRTAAAATTYGFEDDAVGAALAGFTSARTGGGRVGTWVVRAEPGAPSGANVVAQTDADPTDARYPILFAKAPVLADVAVSVRCKPISGKVDQACGLVCRLKDANNYYLTRANALENNVRLYAVEGGKRRQLASYDGPVTRGQWHTFSMICQGDTLTVTWDGAKVLTQQDSTFRDAGNVGLWTKADSVTSFDDLVARATSQP
jgi:hypothetical protein